MRRRSRHPAGSIPPWIDESPVVSRIRNPSFLPYLSIASAVVSKGAEYGVLILAARLLDPYGFGAYTYLMMVVGLINAVVSGGGDMWLNRFTFRTASGAGRAPRIWRYYVATAAAISAIVLCGAFGFLLLVKYKIIVFGAVNQFYFACGIACIMAVTAGLTETFLAVLRAAGRVRLFFLLRDIARPLLFISALVLLRPKSADGVLAILLLVWGGMLAIAVGIAFTQSEKLLPRGRFVYTRWLRMWRHTAGLMFGNLSSRLAVVIDALVLTKIIGLANGGEYRSAAQFAIGFMVVQHFIFLGLPWQIHQTGDPKGIAMVQARQRLLLILSLVALATLASASELILSLLGDRFIDMAPVFVLFLAIRFGDLLWGPQHEILISNGRAFHDAFANLIGLLTWIAGFALLLTGLAPIAAAVAAAAISSAAAQAYRNRVIRNADLHPVYGHPLGPALPIVAAFCIAGAAGWYLT